MVRPEPDTIEGKHHRLVQTSLRLKTISIIGATLLCLVVIVYIPLRLFVLDSFDRLQDQAMWTDVERTRRVLSADLASLDRVTSNFSAWDDTYIFTERPGPWFDKYVTPELFGDNQINLFLIADTQGKVLYSKAYDLGARREVPAPAAFESLVDSPLLRHSVIDSGITGIMMLPGDPMLVASRSILTSANEGPSRGVVVIGRLLNGVEQKRLAEITRLGVSFHRLDSNNINRELLHPRMALLDGSPGVVHALSDSAIAGYALLRDIENRPGLILRVTMTRSIYLQGLTGVFSFSLALAITALVLGFVMVALIERAVLSRLTSLSSQVDAIGDSDDPTTRVDLGGNDELNHLAGRINEMLAAIERTQQQQREEQERAQRQEESLRTRREFISTVSHELRTPLTPINGFVDLLLMGVAGRLSDEQQAFLQTIKANTERMTALVDDLLEVGRIEAGKIMLNREPLDLQRIINDVIEMLRSELMRKELELEVQIAPDLPLVDADAKRTVQVLANLLSNAVKYTRPHGHIWVRTRQRNVFVEVEIEDTGVGLTEAQIGMLFTPFYRADSPLRDEAGGTGLGLSIARSFVELHGGEIWVRSRDGIGSIFGFTLPIHNQLPPPLEQRSVGEPVFANDQ